MFDLSNTLQTIELLGIAQTLLLAVLIIVIGFRK